MALSSIPPPNDLQRQNAEKYIKAIEKKSAPVTAADLQRIHDLFAKDGFSVDSPKSAIGQAFKNLDAYAAELSGPNAGILQPNIRGELEVLNEYLEKGLK